MLHKYECNFYLNGKRTSQVVSAINMNDAQKIIEAQYNGCRIQWLGAPKRID